MGSWDVLIVGYDRATRATLAESLHLQGLTTKALPRAEEAVQMLLAGLTVRLVIADSTSPLDVAGILLDTFRSDYRLRTIPLLLISSEPGVPRTAEAVLATLAVN